MNTVQRKYPKWCHQDPDIKPLIDREYDIYCKYIVDMSISCHRAAGAAEGMRRLSKEIKTLIRKKENDKS
jgi:hypothetical protein